MVSPTQRAGAQQPAPASPPDAPTASSGAAATPRRPPSGLNPRTSQAQAAPQQAAWHGHAAIWPSQIVTQRATPGMAWPQTRLARQPMAYPPMPDPPAPQQPSFFARAAPEPRADVGAIVRVATTPWQPAPAAPTAWMPQPQPLPEVDGEWYADLEVAEPFGPLDAGLLSALPPPPDPAEAMPAVFPPYGSETPAWADAARRSTAAGAEGPASSAEAAFSTARPPSIRRPRQRATSLDRPPRGQPIVPVPGMLSPGGQHVTPVGADRIIEQARLTPAPPPVRIANTFGLPKKTVVDTLKANRFRLSPDQPWVNPHSSYILPPGVARARRLATQEGIHQLTHDEIATLVGSSRTAIRNVLIKTGLPPAASKRKRSRSTSAPSPTTRRPAAPARPPANAIPRDPATSLPVIRNWDQFSDQAWNAGDRLILEFGGLRAYFEVRRDLGEDEPKGPADCRPVPGP